MDRLKAALIFFTRLPLWKVCSPKIESFSHIVAFWPLVGWLSGGLTALLLMGLGSILPWAIAVVLALAGRLLLTGALHEDGLADFFDGFGGGGDKARILAIMKDSHIGTYGVIALIFYILLTAATLWSLGSRIAPWAIFAADPLSKGLAAQLTNFLPYARTEGAKNGISYSRMGAGMLTLCIASAIIPAALAIVYEGWAFGLSALFAYGTLAILIWLMWRKIGGYTGDCCGATALLCELTYILALSALIRL